MADRRTGGKRTGSRAAASGKRADGRSRDSAGYRRLFERVPEGVYQATPDGKVLAANPALLRMLGYDSLDELQGLDLADVYVDPSGRAEWIERIERDGQVRGMEVELRRRDGRPIVVSDSAYVVRDDAGEPLFYEGTLVDVTARKRAEDVQRVQLGIFKSAGAATTLHELLESTRTELSRIIDTSNFYVALYDGNTGTYSFPFHVDQFEPDEVPDRPLPGSLTDYVRRTGRPLLVDAETHRRLERAGEVTLVGTDSPIWLGVPLTVGGEVIGVVGVQSYEQASAYTRQDLELLTFVADNVAQVIERKRAEVELRNSEARFRALFEASPDAIFVEDREGNVLDVNPAGAKLQGIERERLIGMNIEELVPPDRVDWIRTDHQRLLRSGAEMQEGFAYRADGTVTPIEVHVKDFDYAGRDALLLLARDITERKRQQASLEYLSRFDALTDLPNRFLFEDRLQQALVTARRNDEVLALHLLDLDHFNEVNDTLGHATGDRLLKAVAARLSELVRETDTVARLSADEFAVIQTAAGGATGASAFASRVLERLLEPFHVAGYDLQISTCIGITLSGDDDRVEDLLVQADRAAHRAKQTGPGSLHFHDERLAEEVEKYVGIRRDLHGAVERGEFFLVYQPQIDLRSGRVVGAEALVRWQHPRRGLLPPGEFVPITENTGLIVPIGSWVLEEACRQRRAWCDAGLERVPTAVNLSAVQFRDPRFGATVERILERTGVRPRLLELELTESVLMQGSDALRQAVREWRRQGISIVIDDFGTGYSSLRYLREFPVQKLKIAMEFVQGVPADPDDVAIVSAVINLGQTLGLKVIAEGVETGEQAEFLRRHGCDEAQGFYFSKPVSAEEYAEMLK